MSKYQAYSEYQSTEIQWITKVPVHWRVGNIGHECSVKARLGWKGLKAEEYVDEGYIFLATPNIKDKEIDFSQVNRITKERYDESPEIMLKNGDILVTKDGSTTGTTNIVRSLPEPATVNSSIAVLRTKGNVNSDYLYYFFVSDYTQNVITRMRGGMGVPHLFQADLRKFNLLIPPTNEQTQIAAFLDHETAKIDTLIEKQQQLIELLKEKRQAVISHAVTKGLNPNAPMKDSGVEWLGQVPEHWVCCAIKYQLFSQDSHRIPLSSEERGKKHGEYRYYGASGVIDFIDEYIFDESNVLVGEDGANLVNRNTPLAFAAHGKYWVNNHAHILKPLDGLADYWAEVIEIIDVNPMVSGSAQPKLTAEALNNLKIAFPLDIEERLSIESFIQVQKNKYDTLIKSANTQVFLLKERRTALISAAVTGKIDVRHFTLKDGIAPTTSIDTNEAAQEAMA